MTFGEAVGIIYAKIDERDTLGLSDRINEITDPEERLIAIVEEFKANSDLASLRIELVSQIYSTLYEELRISDAKNLSKDTILPASVEALVRKLDKFPWESEYFLRSE